jgi:hypothetical protein
MNLDLTDDEAAALTQDLHEVVENDRYPFSAAHPHAEGDWGGWRTEIAQVRGSAA